jgi:hypothetical protein
MSEADWLTNPKSRDDQGLFVEQPGPLPEPIAPAYVVDQGASQALRALNIAEHDAPHKDLLIRVAQHTTHVSLVRIIKTLLCNDATVGEETAANNRGSGIEMVTNSMRTIFGKIEAHLGSPSYDSAKKMLLWYDTASSLQMVEYFCVEALRHSDLSASGNHLTDNQRAARFRVQHKTRPEVTAMLTMFDYDNPISYLRTLPMLQNFILSKEVLIRAGMTRSDVYSSLAGMAAVSAPNADPPVEAADDHSAYSVDHSTAQLYTHGEVAIIALKAVQSALAAAIAQSPTAPGNNGRRATASHTYESPNRHPNSSCCYHHAQGQHGSSGCNTIIDGHLCRHQFSDSGTAHQ